RLDDRATGELQPRGAIDGFIGERAASRLAVPGEAAFESGVLGHRSSPCERAAVISAACTDCRTRSMSGCRRDRAPPSASGGGAPGGGSLLLVLLLVQRLRHLEVLAQFRKRLVDHRLDLGVPGVL